MKDGKHLSQCGSFLTLNLWFLLETSICQSNLYRVQQATIHAHRHYYVKQLVTIEITISCDFANLCVGTIAER